MHIEFIFTLITDEGAGSLIADDLTILRTCQCWALLKGSTFSTSWSSPTSLSLTHRLEKISIFWLLISSYYGKDASKKLKKKLIE